MLDDFHLAEQRNFHVRIGMVVVALWLPAFAYAAGGEWPLSIESSGGNYRVFWNSVDAGGTRSSAGSYVVSGVVGQADAATSTAGAYQLRGGFLPRKAAPPDGLFANGFE